MRALWPPYCDPGLRVGTTRAGDMETGVEASGMAVGGLRWTSAPDVGGVAPLLPEVGVIALVPDPWRLFWAARHHVVGRLGRYFHTIWIDPAHEWRPALSAGAPSRATIRQVDGLPNFAVYTPELWLPTFYRPKWLARLTFRQRLARASAALKRRGCRKIVLYVWRPEFVEALDAGSFDLTCYHVDDEYTFSEVDCPVPAGEARLLREVDQVFIHSPALLDKKGGFNPHTAFVPNGVEFTAYATPAPEPKDLAAIPRPRIGYTGIVKRQLDWQLLDALAARHSSWSFVFVGPRTLTAPPDCFQALERRANVYFLGGKDVFQLAEYPQHFDACIMPYLANDYTRYIYPLKLHEYLASGRPVVGTRIRSLEDFEDTVALVSSEDDWSGALARALEPGSNTADQHAKRQSVAREHDWTVLVAHIAKTVAERLHTPLPNAVASIFEGVTAPHR